jgi:hypothetical protein
MNFSGADLYAAKASGNFTLSPIRLSMGGNTTDLLTDGHTTASYDHVDFERPPLPDLTITMNATYASGTTALVLNVSNRGMVSAFNIFVDVFDNNTFQNQTSVASLTPNASTIFLFNATNTTASSTFLAIVDFGNIVDESNETNNFAQYPASSNTSNASNATPRVNITLVSPSQNANFTRYAFTPFTVQVCCSGATCGWAAAILQQNNGPISTMPGTPFYTNGSFPQGLNLNANQCANTTWWINATGTINVSYPFFAYVNLTSNQSINNRTTTINVTIVNVSSGSCQNCTNGSLSMSWIIPTQNTNVTKNAFANFTTQVCCSNGTCGNTTVSLDPEPSSRATVEYDYYSRRTCADGTCTIEYYSSPRFGYEGVSWKPLEELRSFRGNVPIDCVVQDDGVHHVECLDYNNTHRRLRISVENQALDAPVQVRTLKPALVAIDVLALHNAAIAGDTPVDETTLDQPATPELTPDVPVVQTVQPVPVKTYEEDLAARQELTFTDDQDVVDEWFAADLHDELHVGETSTNVTLVPNNATNFNGWWESKNNTLAMYAWSDCDLNAYSTDDKNSISDANSGTSIYGSGGGSGTTYSYCHRMQWQIPYNSTNITSISTWAYWTGSLSGGADSITKALYVGNTTSQTWKALSVTPDAWGTVNHTATITSGISDYVQTTGGNNYVCLLLHMNASKSGSSYAYTNFYDTVLTITVDVANGSGGSNSSNASTKGLINTTTGATPFYTTSGNPRTINLSTGQCTNVTWNVNATGNVGTTYVFFAYANQTNNQSNSARTTNLNITIANASGGGNTTYPLLLQNYTFTSSNENFTFGGDWTWDNGAGLIKYTGGDWGGNLYSPNLSLSTIPAYNITLVFTSGNITYVKFAYASSGTSISGDKYHLERSTDTTQHFKHDSASYSSTDDYNNGAQQTIMVSANFTSNTTKACRAGGSCSNSETVGSFTRGDYIAISPGVMGTQKLNITAIEVWRTG